MEQTDLSMAGSVGKELKTSREELAQVRTSLEKEKMTVLATQLAHKDLEAMLLRQLEDQEVTWKQRLQLVSSEYAQALSNLNHQKDGVQEGSHRGVGRKRESCHVCRARRWDYRWSVAVHIRELLSGGVTQGHELDHLQWLQSEGVLTENCEEQGSGLTEAAKDLRMALKHQDHQVKLLEVQLHSCENERQVRVRQLEEMMEAVQKLTSEKELTYQIMIAQAIESFAQERVMTDPGIS
eukprot:Em0009g514a